MKRLFCNVLLSITFIIAGLATVSEITNLPILDFFPKTQLTGSRSVDSYQIKPFALGHKSGAIAAFKPSDAIKATAI